MIPPVSKKAKSGAAPVPKLAAPAAAAEPGRAVATELVGGLADPLLLAWTIRQHPRHADEIVALLAEQHGMAFVTEVLDAVAALQAQHGSPAFDRGHSSDAERLSEGKGEENPHIRRKPDPAERLPYDKDGGWDGVQINCKLGQHDKLAGTDSDGARCSFAVALAAQIFNGPSACAAWLVDWVNAHLPRPAKGRPAGIDGLSLRARAAAMTIAGVADAIGAGTATFGDLSWAQEAMHAYLREGEDDGASGGKETIVPEQENYQELNSVATSGALVMARASALEPGGRLLLVLIGVYGDERPDYIHQLAVMNDGGKLYVYDPENPTGTHLDLATDRNLGKYLNLTIFESATFLIQGMVWPKTPAKGA